LGIRGDPQSLVRPVGRAHHHRLKLPPGGAITPQANQALEMLPQSLHK
jgi:hypothetical protein